MISDVNAALDEGYFGGSCGYVYTVMAPTSDDQCDDCSNRKCGVCGKNAGTYCMQYLVKGVSCLSQNQLIAVN